MICAFKTLFLLFLPYFSCASQVKIKNEAVSDGIVQIINHMIDQYQMRFTLISSGEDGCLKELANLIMMKTNSIIKFVHHNEVNASTINFDESQIILSGSHVMSPDFHIEYTKRLTFGKVFSLVFDPNFTDVDMISEMKKPGETNYIPHDFYKLSSSPENGSMWLMANEMFYNRTCQTFYHPINYFNSSTMSWSHSKFKNEYETFYKCPVQVEVGMQESSEILNNVPTRPFMYMDLIISSFAAKHNMTTVKGPLFTAFQLMNMKTLSQDQDEHLKQSVSQLMCV